MSSQDPCVTYLPTSQVIGLSFTAVSGFISSSSVVFVLLLVGRNYVRNLRHPPPGGEWKLIRTHVDAYLLSLLGSDFLQGIGAILDVKWAADKRVYCSNTCTAQGIIQQIGETGVAMATFAIALHTFLVIFFRWSPGPRASWIWKIGISFIWLYVFLFAIIAYGKHHYASDDNSTINDFFTPTPYWCWISGRFNPERIAGEYFWLWFTAFSSIILYILLYFRVRGNITVDPLNWSRVRFKWKRWSAGDEGNGDAYYAGSGGGARGGEAGKTAAREALSMVWYPVTYTALVLPLSIVRWSTFRPSGHAEPNVPFAVTAVVIFIFGLSGITNVILMLVTRKNLLLFGQRGVINPAKIGPAATGRLAHRAGGKGGLHQGPNGGRGGGGGGMDDVAMEKKGRFNFRDAMGNNKERDDSTDENSADRHHGDTSFAAGRFTTKAFATERSFEFGSDGMPFTPNSPNSPQSPTSRGTLGQPYGTDSFGYGIDHQLSQGDGLGTNTGIPEGMSRDLGSAGEYDLDRDREWRSFGDAVEPSPYSPSGPSAAGRLQPEHDVRGDLSAPSNFLDLSKDSKSVPGSSQEYVASYPPPPSQRPMEPEGRRGSATSKAGSSTHRPSVDTRADYSVPMKFNPTPAPVPNVSPFIDPPTPYNQSRNASSKSLPKSSSKSALQVPRLPTSKSSGSIATKEKAEKSSWAPITSLFSSKKASDPFNPEMRPSTARSDTGLLGASGSNADVEQRELGIRPLHFSRDFGTSLRSSLSLVGSEKERAFGRSLDVDDDPVPYHEALARTRTRTPSHDGVSNSGSWSRAGGRRPLQEEDAYQRPNTSGSGRSYTSYTFGPPGFSTAPVGGLRRKSSAEMVERMRIDSIAQYPYPTGAGADEIGRAV